MNLEYHSWFFVAVVLGVEYGIKEFFELLPGLILKRQSSYWLYRFCHWIILTLLLMFFFTAHYPWFIWPLLALGASLLGPLELIAYLFERKFQKVIRRKSYLLQFPLFIVTGWLAFQTAMMIRCRSGQLLNRFLNWLQLHLVQGTLLTNDKILAAGTMIIVLAYPVNYIIRWLIGKSNDQTLPELIFFHSSPKHETRKARTLPEGDLSGNAEGNSPGIETIRAGRVIGILERWLIMILMLSGQLTGIGFVLTAKSIARFKNFEQHHFAEYYLMGTLYSAVFAIVLSLILINLR
jgi:hypothetical protein